MAAVTAVGHRRPGNPANRRRRREGRLYSGNPAHRTGTAALGRGKKRVRRGRRGEPNSQVVAVSPSCSRYSGPDCVQQRSDTDDLDHPLHIVGQNVEAHLGADPRFSLLVRKCVLPIHDLKVPKGCSTVCQRTPLASGIRSSLVCIASRKRSCFRRLIRVSLPNVHLGLRV